MIKAILLLVGLFFSCTLHSQTVNGIQFENKLSWHEILSKAEREGKYIFIDYYATWCIPCKIMDSKIYTSDTIASFVNKHFISVKVQFDSTESDGFNIVSWRPTANELKRKYQVLSLPTYLFFSSDGNIVHKGIGIKNQREFLKLLYNSLDSSKQYYTLIKRYKLGLFSYTDSKYLIDVAKFLGNNILADSIAKEYIDKYLFEEEEAKLYEPENLAFIRNYIDKTADKGFIFFYSNADKIDALMQKKAYAESLISTVVYKENIQSVYDNMIFDKAKLDAIKRRVSNLYRSNISERVIIDLEMEYSKMNKKWDNYTNLLIRKVEKYGVFGEWSMDFNLNNIAWDIFLHTTDPAALNKALAWSNDAIRLNPTANWIDTKANILYKLGKRKEAIICQKRAIQIGARDINIDDYHANLKKMMHGDPTWPLK